ncbi:MAG: hypothetical protein GQ531_03170 [Sulfurovum sp.]|nr:hypothetical protein [Sulfurovum sp.]
MGTFTRLEKLWKPKHFEYLLYCLKYCQSYFEDHFKYQERRGGTLMVDGEVYTQNDLIKILSEYYEDSSSKYQSEFGDTLYLFFTDLVEDDVDILSELDDEVG